MNIKTIKDNRNTVRVNLEKNGVEVINESTITKGQVVDIFSQLGIIQDRTKYKHQKRYLP